MVRPNDWGVVVKYSFGPGPPGCVFFWSLLYGVCGFRAHQIYWNFSGCLLDCAFTFGLTNLFLDRHKLLLCLHYCLFAQIQATNYFPCKKKHRQRNGYSLIVNPDKQGWEIHSLICPSRQIKKCHCLFCFSPIKIAISTPASTPVSSSTASITTTTKATTTCTTHRSIDAKRPSK